jgi:hypothetical protein
MFVFDTSVQDDILLDFQDEFEPTIEKKQKKNFVRKKNSLKLLE